MALSPHIDLQLSPFATDFHSHHTNVPSYRMFETAGSATVKSGSTVKYCNERVSYLLFFCFPDLDQLSKNGEFFYVFRF